MNPKLPIAALVFSLFVFGGVVFYKIANPIEIETLEPVTPILDSQVPQLEATYVPIDSNPVRGSIDGTITGASLQNQTLYACPITKGKVIEKGGYWYLTCPESALKSVSIREDNTFSISLFSDTYFLHIKGQERTQDRVFPVKVSVHKGKSAKVTIPF